MRGLWVQIPLLALGENMGSNGPPPKLDDMPTSIPPPRKASVSKNSSVSPKSHDELLTFLIVTDILIGDNDVDRED